LPDGLRVVFFLAGVALLGAVAYVVGRINDAIDDPERKERERQAADRARLKEERACAMLYENMTVDEAQLLVWRWEEMTEAERAELSIEERVRFRKVREDLAKHRERWPTS
jgi:hypothetical protein